MFEAEKVQPAGRQLTKKVVLMGHFGVGKSSLVRRFVHSIFSANYQTTVGVDILKKEVTTPRGKLNMILWDIEGGRDHRDLPRAYFAGTSGVLYVCDVSRKETFEQMEAELAGLRQLCPRAQIQVLGNKTDLLTPRSRKALLAREDLPLDFLCSAASGENVEEAFRALSDQLIP